jgi:predicted RNase H-like HicB family nuclease
MCLILVNVRMQYKLNETIVSFQSYNKPRRQVMAETENQQDRETPRVSYACVIEKLSLGGYSASFPDFDGCVSSGDTLDELVNNAKDGLLLHIGGMREDGDEIPSPSDPLYSFLDALIDENTRNILGVVLIDI